MSANPVVVVRKFRRHLESLGMTVFLDPLAVDPTEIGVRLSYSGFETQGDDREKIVLQASVEGHGIDPGAFLSKVMFHSRALSKMAASGLEFPVGPSRKAKAIVTRTAEGRFARDEMSEKLDWIFQEPYRIELSYNPAILDAPDLAD